MQRRRLPSPCPEDFTIGWVSAIPAELAAAQAMFDEVYEDLDSIKGIEAIYSYGRIQGHNVVVGPLPDRGYGKISAAIMSTRMEADFPSIKYFLMVGIGGGVPSAGKDIRLGDVVVGMEVVQYDFVKAHPDGNKRIGDPMSPSRTLRTAVASVRAANGRNEFNILKYSAFFEKNPMLNSFPRQRSGTGSLGDIIYEDILYKADYIHAQEGKLCKDHCDKINIVTREPRARGGNPKVYYGKIASGDQVMKNGIERDRISKDSGGTLCFEMEAAGVMSSVDCRCLVIRGICDYADSHKNKGWQEYAAMVAAAYAREIISVLPAPTKQPVNSPLPARVGAISNGTGSGVMAPHSSGRIISEPFFNHSRLRDYNPSTIYMKNVNFGESMTEESGTNKRKRQREDHCGSRGCESKRSKVGQYRGGDCSSESSSEGEDDEESDSDRDGLDGDSDNSERNGFLELYRELYNGESSDDLEEDHMGVDSSDSGEDRNSGFDSSEEDDNDDDDM
ncbi:hypothetical protein AOL_s00173g236 [Orbilia oligospora ATCC 24927]|uniref:Uncharacterized protein n=1 Tax=Arthrobotrys oligospora (strain ATCC 24927 / CBS 115.81 / DSM 1491) TaxID=756982 RepID=G1XP68_ARTOA|nr:hypothetical protein AOL_s00173g236 [Orbilia oligospora ATCC 24927]EGX45135.1 hypothetical protein AOL_s00173g236 [Orbilia oligospora ATCC 24927]